MNGKYPEAAAVVVLESIGKMHGIIPIETWNVQICVMNITFSHNFRVIECESMIFPKVDMRERLIIVKNSAKHCWPIMKDAISG